MYSVHSSEYAQLHTEYARIQHVVLYSVGVSRIHHRYVRNLAEYVANRRIPVLGMPDYRPCSPSSRSLASSSSLEPGSATGARCRAGPDKWARGSIMNFNKEKDCAWRRRMSKDGKHFARVVHFSEGFALQRGILANPIDLSDNSDSDDEGGAPKPQEKPATAVPAAAPAQGGKKKAEAPAKDTCKKDKGQGSSSQATPAPEELPAKQAPAQGCKEIGRNT